MTLPYKVGDAVLLSREREGIIRYIGNVHFSKGIWCGIELVGGSLGTNDGKMEGRRYFTCSRNRGLFVRIGKVRRKFREKDHTAASRQKRKASLEQRLYHKSLVEQAVSSEMKNIADAKRGRSAQRRQIQQQQNQQRNSVKIQNARNSLKAKHRSQSKPASNNKADWLTERLNSQPTKQKRERAKSARPFKPGPRDIGRIKSNGWKPIEYKETDNSGPGWMKEKLSTPTKSRQTRAKTAPKPFKPGPRDIGRNTGKTGWKPIELSKEEEAKLNSGGFLHERKRSQSVNRAKKKNKALPKVYKPGPRDIGRNSGANWTPIELSKEEESKLNSGAFLDDRSRSKSQAVKSRNKTKGKIFKPGPRDIGRNGKNSKWKPIELSKEEEAKLNSGGFLKDRGRSKSAQPSKRSKGKIFKPGPRDIGRNDNWKQKKVNIKKPKRRENKRFKIKVNDNEVDPKQLTKSKAKNKELMKGKRSSNKRGNNKRQQTQTRVYKPGPRDIGKNNKWKQTPIRVNNKRNGKQTNRKQGKIYKPGPRDIGRNDDWKQNVVITQKSKNRTVFDSFRRGRRGRNGNNNNNNNNTYANNNNNDQLNGYDHNLQRESVTVSLNKNNQAKKTKHMNRNSGNKQDRHSVSVGVASQQYTATGQRINGGYGGRNTNGLWYNKEQQRKAKSKDMYNRLLNGNRSTTTNQHTKNGSYDNNGYNQNIKRSPYNTVRFSGTTPNDADAHRASAYKSLNYAEFTPYNANQDNENNNNESFASRRSKNESAADEAEAEFDLDEEYRPPPKRVSAKSAYTAYTDGDVFDDLEIDDDVPPLKNPVTDKRYDSVSEEEKHSRIRSDIGSSHHSQSDILHSIQTSNHSVYELFSPETSPIPELPDEEAKQRMTPQGSIPTTPTHFGMDLGDDELMANDLDLDSGQLSPTYGSQSGNISPSGHAHLYNNNGDSSVGSPSGHEHEVFDFGVSRTTQGTNDSSITATLFSDSEDNQHRQNIKQYLKNGKMKPLPEAPSYNKPLPNKPLPPNQPSTNNGINTKTKNGKVSRHKKQNSRGPGRIKGIEKYVGKWIVSFKGMNPTIEESKEMNRNRNKRRNSSKKGRSSKKNGNGLVITYTYSIYKDGSVQIQPKSAFGWNGSANIVFDGFHKRFEIHANDLSASDEYDVITINENNTLHIEHFNISSNSTKPIIGNGIKG